MRHEILRIISVQLVLKRQYVPYLLIKIAVKSHVGGLNE
jgi:hypothetical protein